MSSLPRLLVCSCCLHDSDWCADVFSAPVYVDVRVLDARQAEEGVKAEHVVVAGVLSEIVREKPKSTAW